ncbi:enoyl-CoA hydratase [compost metagenome]
MTKKCLHQEWNQTIEQALETESEAQAICMQTGDFKRAYEAFVKKEKPRFQGD